MRHRVWTWLWRYGPAEVAATAGALIGAAIGIRFGGLAGAAIGGVLGEGLAFYGFVLARELRTARAGRRVRRVLADLLVEFGPAEVVDTVAVRPAAMFAGPLLLGDLFIGILAGKVAADLLFYAIAAAGYELSRRVPAADDFPPRGTS